MCHPLNNCIIAQYYRSRHSVVDAVKYEREYELAVRAVFCTTGEDEGEVMQSRVRAKTEDGRVL